MEASSNLFYEEAIDKMLCNTRIGSKGDFSKFVSSWIAINNFP
jgi:hypothetical protein